VPLCLSTLHSIATAARSHPALANPPAAIHHLAIAHRLGIVPTGESSIVIAVSASHRRESFALCEWLLEEVKKKAQVWKREVYADGASVEGAVDGGSEPQSAWKENFKDGKW
jgi:molybdopterin synthase catalytic subunit